MRDRIEFTDARGALRSLRLVERAGAGYWAESTQTSYIKPGLKLYLLRVPSSGDARGIGYAGEVGALPETPAVIRLRRGDSLILTRGPIPGIPPGSVKTGMYYNPPVLPARYQKSLLPFVPASAFCLTMDASVA